MHRRSLILIGLLLVLALPLSASQFVEVAFDDAASGATYIVRGTVDQTWSAWDDAHQVIYTYATVHVTRYFGETTGPDTLVVREVGGTVDGYTQEAIGFPAIRGGEKVVLLLSKWEDSTDLRIHAYNQGKYLVRNRGGVEILVSDPVKQGDQRLRHDRFDVTPTASAEETGLRMDEFEAMVEDARAGIRRGVPTLREQH
ncbi:MAG TPA: hypothetical protein VEK57_08505 [Thermoanaerobaculia bacterium]|nr:hypothetical protein [Thermoanaerobaculia bacterium]